MSQTPDTPAETQRHAAASGNGPYQATEEEIWDSIRYFSAGSAGGPDGLRPQHVTVRGAKCKDIESNGATWKLWTLGMADPNQKVIVDEKYGQVNPRSSEAPDK